MTSRYINEFLGMRCAGDVINAVTPVKNFAKEITESMAMRRLVKGIALKEPDVYELVDLCSGNALIPVLCAYTLPLRYSYAVDRRLRDRRWGDVRRFCYVIGDVDSDLLLPTTGPVIYTACHCCGNIAYEIIDLFREDMLARHLIMMPCCEGELRTSLPEMIAANRYQRWCYALYAELEKFSRVRMIRDKHVDSQKNIILVAEKVR